MLRLTWDLPVEAKYVSLCRQLVRTTLAHMGATDAEVEELELAIGELCGNVVRHAQLSPNNSYVVEFEVLNGTVLLTVTDRGIGFTPALTEDPMPTDSGGLGLWLVGQFTDRLEFKSLDGNGTQVQAERRLGAHLTHA